MSPREVTHSIILTLTSDEVDGRVIKNKEQFEIQDRLTSGTLALPTFILYPHLTGCWPFLLFTFLLER